MIATCHNTSTEGAEGACVLQQTLESNHVLRGRPEPCSLPPGKTWPFWGPLLPMVAQLSRNADQIHATEPTT
jgi:hypothetical protein